MKIDNFALTHWQSCPAKYDLRINQQWTSRRKSGALGAGGALHLGLASWHRNKDLQAAVLAIHEGWPVSTPIDDWRTEEKVITTMIEYTKVYPHELWTVVGAPDNPVIEVPFTIGTGMYLTCTRCLNTAVDKHQPRCGTCDADLEEIEYGGIYDLLIDYSSKSYVCDHKTTSMFGKSYFNQFKPNNQMTGYVWAANRLTGFSDFSGASRMNVTGALINVIAWKAKGKTEFDRQITDRSPADIAEWLEFLYLECLAIQRHKITATWPMRTESCISKYGACEYHSVHTLSHASERKSRLETDYIRDNWDYELRDG